MCYKDFLQNFDGTCVCITLNDQLALSKIDYYDEKTKYIQFTLNND